ncbi:N-acetylmuramic acid 6-phosphate etherase [Erysipelothrix sp. strain 2 (EsS2-6-Brazil)]|uniref:N-acetylmuramic acid 6-phosphate etherase n=1 Tax=Erysipelothrix sp. strain 2 (EsS2-6-Brazil) TaxID=2500549 RepID=UPI00137860F9|nr:N-acetylmuramic acid 6-phosphate etherase [Erysipelothrix sp. strain 2 (EsS2-6-Brazil)]MBK2402474.1 N-acetylmuramic acid 6-phosphate etherase [Erysipelothrix sp. strain 2 (EsS2-6-Brazil)]NBA00669.1 N-acetylmuramic acid 6-phosphate etherase [Erysipelothrix rhusiopathiae]
MKIDLSKIGTELQNPNTKNIDRLDTVEMVALINNEDQRVIDAVGEQTHEIAAAIDATYEAIAQGGRLVYMGAGTSGRLGVLDASECLPTFGVGEESVVGIIAGGDTALRHPVEAAEDDEMRGVEDLKALNFSKNDILCAIGASGRTPYCIGGLKYAKELGAQTISVACVSESKLAAYADHPIEVVVGQEVITGSTRMKSGSATKMVLNMISTGAMIKLGKVYGNLMVDVKATNAKLIERARSIIMNATGCTYDRATDLLDLSDQSVKVAIVMELCNLEVEDAVQLLNQNQGHIARALENK